MNKAAVFHIPQGVYAYALSEHQARIVLRAQKGDLVKCSITHEDRFDLPGSYGAEAMTYCGSDERFDYFQATIESQTRKIRYRFLLEDGVERLWFGETGLATTGDGAGWFQIGYLSAGDLFHVPEWASDAVVYQIFPDRFYNGDSANDPKGGELPTSHTFFGGDLQGIIEKLPYLQGLGVTLLYLTPIFLSPSTHKYDTSDYLEIDPMFGDLATCKRLVQEAHAQGIRVMLDAVFNHCGEGFPPFRDVLEKGADSPFVDWFHLHGFPVDQKKVNYETFANGIASMPKLRTEHPDVRKYLLGVAEYWIQEVGIDGWRLDVANEVDHGFWREFRQVVRRANPEALIIGEVWHDSSPWLQGDQWDGVTNYLFRESCLEFFAWGKVDAVGFDERLTKMRMMYKEQANQAMFNLLGSHDTPRFLTLCGEDQRRMRLAVLFQMTYPGIPQVYYGDEVGMVGGHDPDCRRTMVWEVEQQKRELLEWHQKLIRLRKQHPALRKGSYRAVIRDALTNVYGFMREDEHESVFVVLNNGKLEQRVQVPDGAKAVDLLTGQACAGEVVVEAFGGRVLRILE